MARPETKFSKCDKRLIEVLARYGFRESEIATEIDVDVKTLVKHAGGDIRRARLNTLIAAYADLHRAALRGKVTALLAVIKMGEKAEAARQSDVAGQSNPR
jgi:hypothetical protein